MHVARRHTYAEVMLPAKATVQAMVIVMEMVAITAGLRGNGWWRR